MAVAFSNSGAIAYATGATITPAMPTGVVAGDLLLMVTASKAGDASVTNPAGWTYIGAAVLNDVGGAAPAAPEAGAVDKGWTRISFRYKIAVGGDTSPAVSITSNVTWAQILRFTKDVAKSWDVSGFGTGADVLGGTAWTLSASPALAVVADDLLVSGICLPTDSAPTWGAFTWTGITVGTQQLIATASSTLGQDIGGRTQYAPVTGAGTITNATSTLSGTTANSYGPMGIVRLREVVTPVEAASALAVTATIGAAVAREARVAATLPVTATIGAGARIAGQPSLIGYPDSAAAGVSFETHPWAGPFKDANNNLYVMTESDLASGNRVACFKSTNGGETWIEQDSGLRPPNGQTGDTESGWVCQTSTHFLDIIWMDTGADVKYARFAMSSATAGADTWVRDQNNIFLGSVNFQQVTAAAGLSNGDVMALWTNTAGAQYAKRDATTWGAAATVTGAVKDAIGMCAGAADKCHIFYLDASSNIQHRSLTSAGVLSAAEQVNDTAVHAVLVPFSNPVYYDDAGVEVITLVWANSTGLLRAARIRDDGTPLAEETVNSIAVLTNPGAGNEEAVVRLAVDGKTVYAVWAQGSDSDIYYQTSADEAAWSSAVEIANGVTTYWLNGANIYDRGSGKVLAFVIDNNADLNELTHDQEYWELPLVAGPIEGQATLAVTATIGAAAQKEAVTGSSLVVTATITAAGAATLAAGAALAVTAALSAGATRTAIVGATLPVTATLTAGADHTAAVGATLPVTTTITAGAAREAVVAASLPVTAAITTGALREAVVEATLAATATIATTGALGATTLDAALAITATFTTAASLTAIADATLAVTATIELVATVNLQYGRPDEDITVATGWGVVPLWDKIHSADDTNYVTTSSTISGTSEVGLSSMTAPGAGSVIIRVSLGEVANTDSTVYIALMQGAVEIARLSLSAAQVTITPTVYTYTLTGPEVAAITDWTNLRFRLNHTRIAGLNRAVRFGYVELEAPVPAGAIAASASLAVTAAIATTASREAIAAASLSVTATVNAGALREATVGATLAATATITTAGDRTAVIGASLPVTVDISTAATRTAAVGASLPVTATLSTAGAREAAVGATLPVTATLTTAAAREAFVAASLPVTATIATTGAITGQVTIAASLPVTASITSAGARTATIGISLPVTATVTTSSAGTVAVAATLPVTATLTTAGARSSSAAAALPVTATITTAATRTATVGASLPIVATVTVGGSRVAAVDTTLAITGAVVAGGVRTQPAGASLPVFATISLAELTRTHAAAATLALTALITAAGDQGDLGLLKALVESSRLIDPTTQAMLTPTGSALLAAPTTVVRLI